MLNIDLNSVGNWAERNNVIYASYQELAGNPDVYKMLAEHVDEVNKSLAEEERVARVPDQTVPDPASRNSMPTTARSHAPRRCAVRSLRNATPH
jgi:long-subunit acyl-CoA synthetase (AMP-forming)